MTNQERAEWLAAEIDAILHGGQRAPMRYRKIVPAIEAALIEACEEEAEAVYDHCERHGWD